MVAGDTHDFTFVDVAGAVEEGVHCCLIVRWLVRWLAELCGARRLYVAVDVLIVYGSANAHGEAKRPAFLRSRQTSCWVDQYRLL